MNKLALTSVLVAAAGGLAANTLRAAEADAVTRDIPYLPAEAYTNAYVDQFCRLNLRIPQGVTNFPTVVWFHGGGLIRGSRGGFCRTFEEGIAGVSGGYRLIADGKATPTDCVSDAAAVVAWTLRHIAEYGGDPKKVFVSGSSGGGYLTMMVGMDPKWLKPHGFTPNDLAGIFPQTGQAGIHFTIRKVNGDDSPTYLAKLDEWAPLSHAARDLPPILLQTGEAEIDMLCRAEESKLLYSSLLALGHRDVSLCQYWGRNHGSMSLDAPYYQDDFIRRRCREIDGAKFSGGPNKVRACLERAIAGGLGAEFVSVISSPGYDLRTTCVPVGSRYDLPVDGEWAKPLLVAVARAASAVCGGTFPEEGDPLPPDVPAKIVSNFVDAREYAIYKAVTLPLGMPRTRAVGKKGARSWQTSGADMIRLAQAIARDGEWHGRRIFPAGTFPRPFAFANRLFAQTDGSARVLLTAKAVGTDALAGVSAEWQALDEDPFAPKGAAAEKLDRRFLDGLLRIRSVTGDREGILRAADYVRDWALARGLHCSVETNSIGLVGLYVGVTPGKVHDYLFVSHVDVVTGPDEMFVPRYEGDRFFARGACDTKGNVVAICQTLANLAGSGASVAAFFATDEEGGRGPQATAQMMIDRGYVPRKLVLVADTAGEAPGQLFTGEKGHIVFSLVAKGRGGHSSRPWSADNPVPRLCEGYLKFKAAWDAQDRPELGQWRTVVSPTKLEGGAVGNIIPDEATMGLSCRFVVPEDKERVEKMIAEASGLEVRAPSSWRAPVVNRPDEPEIRSLLRAMDEGIPGGMKEGKMSAATDASFYTQTGVPCVVYTADAGEPHSVREWGSLASLEAYCAFFTRYFRSR